MPLTNLTSHCHRSADDVIETRGTRHATLRDNVLFELGLFMGKLTRYRAILVHPRVTDLKLLLIYMD